METQQRLVPQEDHWALEQVINGLREAVHQVHLWAVVHLYQFLQPPTHLIFCEYLELATQLPA
jgi:hypothetical protein